ncbi:hypothetical protein GA0115260_100671, partial [Streptomyces sp. MnatMP-M27]
MDEHPLTRYQEQIRTGRGDGRREWTR